MADYLPIYLPGNAFTSTASTTITGGQLLAVSGSGTVGPAGASAHVIGTAGNDAVANGLVTVYGRGAVHSTVNSGGVTAGDQLVSAASGQVATLAASATSGTAASDINTAANNARKTIGIALTTAATAVAVQWIEC